ncbi:SDR family oxidoreductase [Sulfitobacter litoralis]|uniref:SDR family oxidoreductase n=1 Tax=Sulfitobacter litoralis TaxID=335975 RepID=UPI001428C8C5|nr:sugar nucleotide-binding protein [Sulfitobacter litoralis]
MKILLLGSTGMAGQAFETHLVAMGHEVVGAARSQANINLDISVNEALLLVLETGNFDAVVNAAAIVDIERCELDPLLSWKTNAAPLAILATWTREYKIPLLHISTDHYYPYGDNFPHGEDAPVYFLNTYAKHKYAAEAFALASPYSLVLRTSILSSRKNGGKTLVEWALDSLSTGKRISVFSDAWTSSMDVDSFARLGWEMFNEKQAKGLYNLACREVYSKEALIRGLAEKIGYTQDNLFPASIKDVFLNRPNCLGLDPSRAEKILGKKCPDLNTVLDNLLYSMKFSEGKNILH